MKTMITFLPTCLLFLFSEGYALGGSVDKSEYNLFHPTPSDEMRPFDADRPGSTDSPRTVDAGHVKVEDGLVNYTLTHGDGTETTSYTVNSLSLGAGLTDSMELQIGIDTYTWTGNTGGVGDVTARVKWNLFGNEAGPWALGVIPTVKVPTSPLGNHRVEEGVHLPVAVDLPEDFSLGFMPEWDYRKNTQDEGSHHEVTAAATVGHPVSGPLSAFGQAATTSSTESGTGPNSSAGVGFTYKLGPDTQLDAGLNFGLSPAASDRNVSAGLSFRY